MARSIATTTPVDRAELHDFVRPRHRLLLVTARRDGRPQISPVSGGVEPGGRIVISTYPRRARIRNAERDPRVSVLEYREAMRIQDKSLIRITPTRWGPIATGGFPADVAARLDG